MGTYSASVEAMPRPAGWGASETEALGALGDILRSQAVEEPPSDSLTALGQALTAASVLSADDLVAYLAGWASETVLAGEADARDLARAQSFRGPGHTGGAARNARSKANDDQDRSRKDAYTPIGNARLRTSATHGGFWAPSVS